MTLKRKSIYYTTLTCISVGFILYALIDNYVIDPDAADFLSRKTGLSRELRLPVWLTVMHVHVFFACLAMAAGLVNFSDRIFRHGRKLHRINGYIYLVSVLAVVATSGYMAPYATGGKISGIGFNALNMIWLIITVTAVVRAKKKRIIQHRNWMIRSYAFCYTNLLIHLTVALLHDGFGLDYAASYTVGVYAAIVLLSIVPNVIIRQGLSPGSHPYRN